MKRTGSIIGTVLVSALAGLLLALQYGATLLDRFVCPPPNGPNLCLLLGTVATVMAAPVVFAVVAFTAASIWKSS